MYRYRFLLIANETNVSVRFTRSTRVYCVLMKLHLSIPFHDRLSAANIDTPVTYLLKQKISHLKFVILSKNYNVLM